jgi:hypothetical protein
MKRHQSEHDARAHQLDEEGQQRLLIGCQAAGNTGAALLARAVQERS